MGVTSSSTNKNHRRDDMDNKNNARSTLQDDIENNNNEFIIDSQARTSLLFRQQDETLDDLDVAITRVGHLAGNIHDEIHEQNKILAEMDKDLDDAEERMGVVMGKLSKVLKTKDRYQICTILALSGTVVVLFFLVLYF